jgi:hypothetical protein
MQVISPNSTAMTSRSPAMPGRMKAGPSGRHVRSAPAVSMIRRRPNRAMIWRGDNPHPSLTTRRDYLGSARPEAETWTPK